MLNFIPFTTLQFISTYTNIKNSTIIFVQYAIKNPVIPIFIIIIPTKAIDVNKITFTIFVKKKYLVIFCDTNIPFKTLFIFSINLTKRSFFTKEDKSFIKSGSIFTAISIYLLFSTNIQAKNTINQLYIK